MFFFLPTIIKSFKTWQKSNHFVLQIIVLFLIAKYVRPKTTSNCFQISNSFHFTSHLAFSYSVVINISTNYNFFPQLKNYFHITKPRKVYNRTCVWQILTNVRRPPPIIVTSSMEPVAIPPVDMDVPVTKDSLEMVMFVPVSGGLEAIIFLSYKTAGWWWSFLVHINVPLTKSFV